MGDILPLPKRPTYTWWISYTPTENLSEYGIPVVGDRVVMVGNHPGYQSDYGLNDGYLGTVVAHGRGREADRQFKDSEALAIANGRELTQVDYEILVDNEGPVVRFDNGAVLWFPGQSIGAIKIVEVGKAKADAAGICWYNPECKYTNSHTHEMCGMGCGTKEERGEQ